jgi:hypothetical protein
MRVRRINSVAKFRTLVQWQKAAGGPNGPALFARVAGYRNSLTASLCRGQKAWFLPAALAQQVAPLVKAL